MTLIAILVCGFVSALLARPVALRWPARMGWIIACVPAAMFAAFVVLGSRMGAEGISESVVWVPSLDVALSFRLDGFSLLFALLITGIGALVVVYSGGYFADKPPREGARFIALVLLFMSAMLGTVLSDHLLILYLFWEMTSLVSFMLIGFDSEKEGARKAALQSLIVTAGGGLALFAGILLIGATMGTFSLREIALRGGELVASPAALPILVLVLAGAFTKSAQVPFQFWLPNAMAAPSPASAYLHSATMVKLGVYLLARFDTVFAAMPAFATTLVAFGSATLLAASLGAMTRAGYKAVLAQTTVGSLGLLVLLIGLDGPLASLAMVSFLLAHALYKATLFFCAGTAIHATGRTSLVELNGLGRALPVSATAALLAALSMSGLPPTFGFIAKEIVFEAQLDSAFGWVVIAAAVLGSAVFVAVGLIASLRPFFLGRERRTDARHGETIALFVGPLVLAVLGFAFGLYPPLASGLVASAAAAVAGRPVEVSLSLWHGWTPMLALSGLVVVTGLLLYVLWPKLLARLAHVRVLDRLLGDSGYTYVFGATLRLAERCTRILQNGDQHRYTAIVVTATLLIVGYGLAVAPPPAAFDVALADIRPSVALVLVFMVVGAVAAVAARSLIAALVSIGIVGFGSALVFLLNGAPDLALTQFSVEILVVVVLTAVLLRLPLHPQPTRRARERRWDAVLAASFGVVLFAALAALPAVPFDGRLSAFFAAASYPEAFGRNVVNVILVDFRAIDTLGEIAVVSFAAIGVWGVLRRRNARRTLA